MLKDYIKEFVPDWIVWVLLPIVIVVVILFYAVSIKIGRTLKKGGKEAEELRGPIHKTIWSMLAFRLIVGIIGMIILFYIAYSYLQFEMLSPFTLLFIGFIIFAVSFAWFLSIMKQEKHFALEKGSALEKEQQKKIVIPVILMVVGALLMMVSGFLFL